MSGPAVEPAIILANAGHFEAELTDLERAAGTLRGSTPHVEYTCGYVKMEIGSFREALEALRK